MLFAEVAAASHRLAATRSRNEKRELIADCLTTALAEGDAEQVAVIVGWLSGSPRQRRTGVGWVTLSAAPPPAATATLRVDEVDAVFDRLAMLTGPGSATARTAAALALLGCATEDEQQLLFGLLGGELRQGALEAQVQEGLAVAVGTDAATIRRAAMLLGSTAAAARVAARDGAAALSEIGLSLGVAVQPMLAASAPDPITAVAKAGLPVLVDHKLDGVRIQVHRDGDTVRVFTRSLDEITARLPEVVETVRALPHQRMILDGEVLLLRPDGRPEKFQATGSRVASNGDARRLTPYFFDLLLLGDRSLLTVPLRERAALMAAALPDELVVPRRVAASADEVGAAFAEAVGDGYEGIVVKDLDAGYAAGRRAAAWTKVKPRHTLDLVVLAAEWGHGRRQGRLSNLHLGARAGTTPADTDFVMLGKTFKGLTDELLAWQTERLLALETRRTRSTVFVRPELVVEIAFDGVQDSTRYPGGVALRFARVLRYRDDKTADQADTLAQVLALGAG